MDQDTETVIGSAIAAALGEVARNAENTPRTIGQVVRIGPDFDGEESIFITIYLADPPPDTRHTWRQVEPLDLAIRTAVRDRIQPLTPNAQIYISFDLSEKSAEPKASAEEENMPKAPAKNPPVLQWYARGGGIARMGPFDSQVEATDALELAPEDFRRRPERRFPPDAFVWPEWKQGS